MIFFSAKFLRHFNALKKIKTFFTLIFLFQHMKSKIYLLYKKTKTRCFNVVNFIIDKNITSKSNKICVTDTQTTND